MYLFVSTKRTKSTFFCGYNNDVTYCLLLPSRIYYLLIVLCGALALVMWVYILATKFN